MEKRIASLSTIAPVSEARASSHHGIKGIAVPFNSTEQILPDLFETILPNAFDDCLRRHPDVRLLGSHNPDILLGRVGAGTMSVRIGKAGVEFTASLPDNSIGNYWRDTVARGDIGGVSIGFFVGEDEWTLHGKLGMLRTILRVEKLIECSLVTWPAYSQTSVAMTRDAADVSSSHPSVAESVREAQNAAILARLSRIERMLKQQPASRPRNARLDELHAQTLRMQMAAAATSMG